MFMGWMYRHPTEAINKILFSLLFAEAYNKTETVKAAAKGFMSSGNTSFHTKGMLRTLSLNCME
jgi:hypothetical protein